MIPISQYASGRMGKSLGTRLLVSLRRVLGKSCSGNDVIVIVMTSCHVRHSVKMATTKADACENCQTKSPFSTGNSENDLQNIFRKLRVNNKP